MKLFILLALLACSAFGGYTSCATGQDTVTITNVDAPSILHKGTNATLTITGNIASPATTGSALYIYADIGGAKLPFPGMNHNMCEIGLTCPTPAGPFSFQYQIMILPSYPSFKSLPVLFRAVDQSNNEMFCIVLTLQITS